MAGDTTLTIIGNLTKDPELRFTPSGAAVAKFTVASTPRYLDKESGQWKDGDPLFLFCNVWRQLAENVAESLQKGSRVLVSGRLRQRQYEKDGQTRTIFELEVDEIGPSLKYATAKVQKMASAGDGRPAAAPADDPWAGASPTRPANADTSQQASFEDTPPF